MHKLAVIICLALGTLTARAQLSPGTMPAGDLRRGVGAQLHVSMSREFVVRDADNPGARPIPLGPDISVHYIRIDPALLTVTCERIKHALLKEIDAPDRWRDQVYIDLQHAETLDDPVIIASAPTARGWSYHVSLPDTVAKTRLITSIVDMTMLEMANRNGTKRSAEIPAWLGYGFSEDIARSSSTELVLEPVKPDANGLNIGMLTIVGMITNALAVAHTDLQSAPPLTLDQLSWPDETRLDGPAGVTYRATAQLFVHELLHLKDGPAAMRLFIEELPQRLNWQLSFLDAFKADFASQLELEKWWALRLVDFTGRDMFQTWNAEESWGKLHDIVRPIVEVRTRVDELPVRSEISLQAVIQTWDTARQVVFLQARSKELYSLRSRVSQELAKLTDDYRRTIDVYLTKRREDGYIRTPRTQALLGVDRVVEQAIHELDVLDSIREDLRPKAVSVQSVDARAGVNN